MSGTCSHSYRKIYEHQTEGAPSCVVSYQVGATWHLELPRRSLEPILLTKTRKVENTMLNPDIDPAFICADAYRSVYKSLGRLPHRLGANDA